MTKDQGYALDRFPFDSRYQLNGERFRKAGSLNSPVRLVQFPGVAELSDVPDPEWWIEGLIPDAGVTLIVGKPDSCKSWLTLLFARCSVLRLPFLGRAVKRRWILYVDGENGQSVMKQRCGILAMPSIPLHLRFWCLDDPQGAPPPLDNPIYFALAKKYRPVLIFDPLREFFSGADKPDTNIESALLPTLRAAKHIAHSCRVPIILVHHSSDKDSRNTYLHTTHIRGAVDAGYFIRERKADPNAPHLHGLLLTPLKGRRAEKSPFNMTLNLRTGEFDEAHSPDEQNLEAAAKLKRLLRKHPGISQRAIAKKLGLTRWGVQQLLSTA